MTLDARGGDLFEVSMAGDWVAVVEAKAPAVAVEPAPEPTAATTR